MKLLLAEDDETVRFTVRDALEERGYTVTECSDGRAAMRAVDSEQFDIVVSDVRMPGVDGITLFRHVRQAQPGTGVVLMTAFADTKDAVAVMREGARDYVLKPFDIGELMLRIARVGDEVAFRRSMETGDASAAKSHPILGVSPPMVRLAEQIDAAAATDVPVLITGEVGTGKDLCARTIHARSRRSTHPFVAVDCAALSKPLEVELFGREKEATTGADRRRKGYFQDANGGTLLLDEVGELPTAIQAKLLNVIDTKSVQPVGSIRPGPVNLRVIACSRRSLDEAVVNKRFRHDLLYRLKIIEIPIPPLRERREDIPLLIGHFLSQIAAREGLPSRPVIEPAAAAALATWDYPGNIHELTHVLERAVAHAFGTAIGLQHLPPEMVSAR